MSRDLSSGCSVYLSTRQGRLQERRAPAIEHNITQDVCLPFVYLCLRDEVEGKNGRRTLRSLCRVKLKVTVKEAQEVHTGKKKEIMLNRSFWAYWSIVCFLFK